MQIENIFGSPTFPRHATDLLLVRHGEAEKYVPGAGFGSVAGHSDPPLSDIGRRQSAALASRLAPYEFAAMYVSSLLRTHETAKPLTRVTGVEPTVVDDLREVHLGEWESGRYRIMAAERHPKFVEHMRTGRWSAIPGAEDDAVFRARIDRALDAIVARHPSERVLVITHGGVIAGVIARAYASERSLTVGVDPTSITQVVATGEGMFVLRRTNDTGHLGDALSQPVFG